MLDYIFFNTELTQKFSDFLTTNKVEFSTAIDDDFGTVQGTIVSVDEDIDDNLLDDLQDLYDQLQLEQEKILEGSEEGLITNVAGMEVNIGGNRTCTLKVNPDVVSKMLTVVSFEELQSFVEDVTHCVQNPDNKPVCQK